MTRDDDWLLESVRAIDRVFFGDDLHELVEEARFVRFRPTKTLAFVYAKWREPIIEVNHVLARDWVPDYVVMSTVYHEMLHAKLGPKHDNAFAMAEMRFPHQVLSEVWCSENLSKLQLAERASAQLRRAARAAP